MPSEQLSLSQLNLEIQKTLEANLMPFYWVVAEIGEMRVTQRGHCYLELVEKEEEQIKAKLRANVWAFTYRKLSGWFEAITRESLKPGMKILCQVQVQFHAVYGLSVTVKDIDPNYTVGERARNREEVIKKLQSEGIYDLNKEHELPEVIQRVAIISSESAAGYGDFMNQIRYNEFGYAYQCTLFNATMQGADAKASIIEAMYDVHADLEDYDILIIIRGGGASLDLDCFDTYDLAFHITQFPIPVITGIGHERDETVADLVAHTKLKTPTAVAEFIINRSLHFEASLDQIMQRIEEYTLNRFKESRHELELMTQQIRHLVETRVGEQNRFMERAVEVLKHLVPMKLKAQQDRLDLMANSLKLLDPKSVLKRGYTITTLDGVLLKNLEKKPSKGDVINTRTEDGNLESIVK